MKKWTMVLPVLLAAAFLSAGCGSRVDVPLNQMEVERYVTLGDYNNLSVSVAPASVDEEELEQLLRSVYSAHVTAQSGGVTDRPVEQGDTVVMDYEGKKDGVAFDGGTAQNASLTIGSGRFIPGFEDGLIGVMPGETVDLKLSFPEGYGNAELAGQAVVFTVTVHFIVPTQMEDAVVAGMGIEGVDTVEGLRQYAYDYLYENANTNYHYSLQDAIVGALLEQSNFENIPEEMVEEYRQKMQDNLETAAASYGISADSYALYNYGMNCEDMVNTYAEDSLRQNLAMQAIANAEGLTVGDEELQELLLEYAVRAGFETVEEFIGEDSLEDYRDYFMNEKVMDYLIEKVKTE